ncbi:MAG: fasciclin domain-containing protein [Pirellulales bacterium]|nr:fasciclin domain-containing protein [Pirellulales bacterium]
MKRSLSLLLFAAVAPGWQFALAAPCSSSGQTTTAHHVATAAPATAPTIVGAAAASKDFSTLVAAVKAAGLVETLSGDGPFTVFAPTDAAFGKLPKGTVAELLKPENRGKLTDILKYHVVAGNVPASEAVKLSAAKTVLGKSLPLKVVDGGLTVGGAKVVKADLACSNGVIHVIDSVLLPPTDEAAAEPAAKDIVDTAIGAEGFSTLVAAVKAAGLVDTLKGEGPFTVFAPTDAAFAKLPKETLAGLLKPEAKADLTKILTYHVVSGKVMAADVVKLKSAKTAAGGELAIAVGEEGVKVNDAKVIKTDIECANGVIHVIDAVLLP